MANELIRLIDPDSAHAVEETAKAVGKAIDAAAGTGKYIADVLGDLPRNVVGIAGDWVEHKRLRNQARLCEETEKMLQERGVEDRNDPSPSVLIPLLAAAIDEDRDELRELWASLLAATLDPSRCKFFRAAFIDAAKRMDPLDAVVMKRLPDIRGMISDQIRKDAVEELKVTRDQIDVSVDNLDKLGLLSNPNPPDGTMTAFGREFMRAII